MDTQAIEELAVYLVRRNRLTDEGRRQLAAALMAPVSQLYVVLNTSVVNPDVYGPFATEYAAKKAASQLYKDTPGSTIEVRPLMAISE